MLGVKWRIRMASYIIENQVFTSEKIMYMPYVQRAQWTLFSRIERDSSVS